MNEIEKVEYFDDRIYKVKKDGIEHFLASVTTKLGIEAKPFLYRYYAELGWDQARKKLHEAGERGSRIHYAWYIYIMGGIVLFNPWQNPIYTDDQIGEFKKQADGLLSVLTNQDEMVAMWKLQRFFETVKPKILNSEMTVYDIEKRIAGTLDNAFLIQEGAYQVNGAKGLTIPKTGIYVADLKTGNQVSESAWAQLASYVVAYESMGYGPVEGAAILHTSSQNRKGIEGFSVSIRTREELKKDFEIYQHLSAVWDARNPDFGPIAFQFPSLIRRDSK